MSEATAPPPTDRELIVRLLREIGILRHAATFTRAVLKDEGRWDQRWQEHLLPAFRDTIGPAERARLLRAYGGEAAWAQEDTGPMVGTLRTNGPTATELDAALAWVAANAGADNPLGAASNHKYALYAAVEGYLTNRRVPA